MADFQLGQQHRLTVDRMATLEEAPQQIAQGCGAVAYHVLVGGQLDGVDHVVGTGFHLPPLVVAQANRGGPIGHHRQGFDQIIVDSLNIWTGAPNLSQWEGIVASLDSTTTRG